MAETACIHGNLPDGISDWRVLMETAGKPRDLVPPIPPFPIREDSLCREPDPSKLPTVRGISVGTADGEDFLILFGDFLDAFYLYGTGARTSMIRDAPVNMPEPWQVPFLGGTVAVLARRFDLAAPDWTGQPRCFLPPDDPYFPYPISNENRLTAPPDTPPEFKERNIFVSGYVLYRA
ncbi:MAG: hypothetical protein LBR80_14325 [Deltaproteobacteria bacterium]|nr:hypothetical protein [Deltaproteobacteria bacterium]